MPTEAAAKSVFELDSVNVSPAPQESWPDRRHKNERPARGAAARLSFRQRRAQADAASCGAKVAVGLGEVGKFIHRDSGPLGED